MNEYYIFETEKHYNKVVSESIQAAIESLDIYKNKSGKFINSTCKVYLGKLFRELCMLTRDEGNSKFNKLSSDIVELVYKSTLSTKPRCYGYAYHAIYNSTLYTSELSDMLEELYQALPPSVPYDEPTIENAEYVVDIYKGFIHPYFIPCYVLSINRIAYLLDKVIDELNEYPENTMIKEVK